VDDKNGHDRGDDQRQPEPPAGSTAALCPRTADAANTLSASAFIACPLRRVTARGDTPAGDGAGRVVSPRAISSSSAQISMSMHNPQGSGRGRAGPLSRLPRIHDGGHLFPQTTASSRPPRSMPGPRRQCAAAPDVTTTGRSIAIASSTFSLDAACYPERRDHGARVAG